MIPNLLLTKLQDFFAPLAMRIQGVRDVLVREAEASKTAAQDPGFIVLVIIDDEHFAESSAVVLAVFNAFLEGSIAGLSVSLRMRPLRLDRLRQALGYGAEWHPCVPMMQKAEGE